MPSPSHGGRYGCDGIAFLRWSVDPLAALVPLVRANVADVTYTPPDRSVPLVGDIYRPIIASPAPAILMIHGDGRIGDDGRWQMTWIARQLAAKG